VPIGARRISLGAESSKRIRICGERDGFWLSFCYLNFHQSLCLPIVPPPPLTAPQSENPRSSLVEKQSHDHVCLTLSQSASLYKLCTQTQSRNPSIRVSILLGFWGVDTDTVLQHPYGCDSEKSLIQSARSSRLYLYFLDVVASLPACDVHLHRDGRNYCHRMIHCHLCNIPARNPLTSQINPAHPETAALNIPHSSYYVNYKHTNYSNEIKWRHSNKAPLVIPVQRQSCEVLEGWAQYRPIRTWCLHPSSGDAEAPCVSLRVACTTSVRTVHTVHICMTGY